MKYLFFVLVFCFISCNDKTKYQGKWRLDVYKTTPNTFDPPFSIYIENDSIKFNYWSFDHWHKFPLKIKNNTFSFNNWTINTNIIQDTLSLKHTFYIKYKNDSILNWTWSKPITKIELPKIAPDLFNLEEITENRNVNYIYFGKRLDNNKFSLQLNDRYAEVKDLIPFLASGCGGAAGMKDRPLPISILFIEKSTPMQYIEDVFYHLKLVNQLKVHLVNNINLRYTDTLGLNYVYEIINKKLPSFHKNDLYNTNISNNKTLQPSPPPYQLKFNKSNRVLKFLLLKKDKIYYENKIIKFSSLKNLITPWVENDNLIFSLYSLESTYGSFLEMNAIINSAYNDVKQKRAKTKFNKKLNNLTREDLTEIRIQTSMHHIRSYSIPHYNLVVEKENCFFDVKLTKKM